MFSNACPEGVLVRCPRDEAVIECDLCWFSYVTGGGGCKVFDLHRGTEMGNFAHPKVSQCTPRTQRVRAPHSLVLFEKGVTAGLGSLGTRMALFVGPALWTLEYVATLYEERFSVFAKNKRNANCMFRSFA